ILTDPSTKTSPRGPELPAGQFDHLRSNRSGHCLPCCHRALRSRARPLLERPGIPDSDGPVEAARGEQVAIRTECDADHSLSVAADGEDLLAANRVPELDRAIIAGRGDPPPIGAEGHVEHLGCVAVEFAELPA